MNAAGLDFFAAASSPAAAILLRALRHPHPAARCPASSWESPHSQTAPRSAPPSSAQRPRQPHFMEFVSSIKHSNPEGEMSRGNVASYVSLHTNQKHWLQCFCFAVHTLRGITRPSSVSVTRSFFTTRTAQAGKAPKIPQARAALDVG